MAPNLGNYLSGNCTDKVAQSFHNTGLRQLCRSMPAAKLQYIVPFPVVVDPADVVYIDVRPGLSDSDHYGVHYMPPARAEYNVIIIGANLPGKLINVPGLVVGDLV